jgi:hypothetical protein
LGWEHRCLAFAPSGKARRFHFCWQAADPSLPQHLRLHFHQGQRHQLSGSFILESASLSALHRRHQFTALYLSTWPLPHKYDRYLHVLTTWACRSHRVNLRAYLNCDNLLPPDFTPKGTRQPTSSVGIVVYKPIQQYTHPVYLHCRQWTLCASIAPLICDLGGSRFVPNSSHQPHALTHHSCTSRFPLQLLVRASSCPAVPPSDRRHA